MCMLSDVSNFFFFLPTYYFLHHLFFQLSYHFPTSIECMYTAFKTPISFVIIPTFFFLLPTSSSYFLLPTSYFLLPISYFLLPTSYFLLPTSYFNFQPFTYFFLLLLLASYFLPSIFSPSYSITFLLFHNFPTSNACVLGHFSLHWPL